MQDYIARPPVAVVLNGQGVAIAPGVRRLRSAEYLDLMAASQALAQARDQAGQIVRQAQSVSEDARRQGLQQGRAEARAELSDSVAQLRAQLSRWAQETEPRLMSIVLRCVREIVRGVDTDILVQDSVHRALAEMSAAQDVRIQVHESEAEALRAQVGALMERHDLRGVIRVEASAALKPGDCIVESPLGVVDLRVESQLRFVQQTLAPQ